MKYILILTFIYSCMSPRQNKQEIRPSELSGTYCLVSKQVNYPSISFKKDSIAIFTSLGDTIYYFKFYVNYDKLFLINKDKLIENRILKLSNDSLIFENLVDDNTKQIYYRCD